MSDQILDTTVQVLEKFINKQGCYCGCLEKQLARDALSVRDHVQVTLMHPNPASFGGAPASVAVNQNVAKNPIWFIKEGKEERFLVDEFNAMLVKELLALPSKSESSS